MARPGPQLTCSLRVGAGSASTGRRRAPTSDGCLGLGRGPRWRPGQSLLMFGSVTRSSVFTTVSVEDEAMRHIVRPRPVETEETHRATAFEIFFDLVFVFALTRTISFMAQPPTPLLLAQGMVILLLLWWSFTAYAWLGNQVRADIGLIRAGMLVAMAAIFVAALVIPHAWRHANQPADAPLALAAAYIVVRAVHLVLFVYVAAGNR